MSSLDRAALIAEMLRAYAQLLEERVPEGPLTLEQIETLVEELGRDQDTVLQDALLQTQVPPPDNQAACPRCHGPAFYKRVVPLDVLTIHGSRSLAARRYHYCAPCGHGFAPLDLRLQIGDHRATRQVRAWQAKYGSLDAFVTVPELLRDLRGLVISESTVERTTLEVGQTLVAAERAAVQQLGAPDAVPDAVRRGPGTDRLYVEMDGVFCPLREPWRKDGSLGKLRCRYGECKVGVVFQTDQRDGLDEGVRWRAYTATLEPIEGFTPRLVALARTHGSERARELVVLGDGAHWIWNLCAQHFPRAVQIVDYWHMTEHLYKVANARFGPGTEAGKEWVKDCQWYLDRDLPASVLAKIQEWQPEAAAERQIRDTEYGYFAANQERMRYETFLKRGYHIGSGVVEASCRQLVTQRLDESGMHWREPSAEAVLAIRAKLKSSAHTDLRAYC